MKMIRNNLLFVRFLVQLNVSSSLILLKLMLYVVVVSYLVYYLMNNLPEPNFPGLYVLVSVLIIIPFCRVFIWNHIETYKSLINQLYSSEQVWIGLTIFGWLASLILGFAIILLLKFFGLAFVINTKIAIGIALMLLSLNAVIQFCSTLFISINSNSSTWLYLLVIPLSIPIFSSTLAVWKKRSVLTPMSIDSSWLNEEVWLFGIFILFTAVSYLLFSVIWKT